MRQLNPRKLLGSKWTACRPLNRERHFMVIACHEDENGVIREVDLEAVINRRMRRLPWESLRSTEDWQQGWE